MQYRKIIFANSFLTEVEDIYGYIKNKFGEIYAVEFESELRIFTERLSMFPELSKSKSLYGENLRGIVFRGKSWIFIDFTEDQIIFLHIIDARRNI